jgi:hypothetical protein
MRNIWTVLALTMVVGCGGGDGKDGRDGAQGSAGPAGVNGKDGDDGAPGATGKDGAPGADGTNGTNGTNGADGTNGVDGADGGAILKGTGAPAVSLGADGDLYIDTVSRDVYQKAGGAWTVITNLSGGPPGAKGDTGAKGDPGTNGTDGTDGTNGTSVRTGAGAPAAGLGAVGDVYIDSTTGDLYLKSAGGWAKTGNLMGPAGTDGTDGTDGTSPGESVGGVRWFAFALTSAFVDAPQLLTSETYTAASSAATFTFTGASQHGRLAFDTSGSFVAGGVNLSSYESLALSATVTGGAVGKLVVVLNDGAKKGCQWDLAVAGPAYSVNLGTPTSCYNNTVADADFDLGNVTQIQIGIASSAAGARTLTVTALDLVDSL